MKLKKITVFLGLSLTLASCSNLTGSNIDTSKTNLALDHYQEEEKPNNEDTISVERDDINTILNKNQEEYEKIKPDQIDVEEWKNRLVQVGEFDQDFVDNLAKERIKDLVEEAENLSQKTGYWDKKDFVFQELGEAFPEKSEKFPLDSVKAIYEWDIADDDEGRDKYQNERNALIEEGVDQGTVNSLLNNELKALFQKAYKENEDGLYDDYIKIVAGYIREGDDGSDQVENAFENQEGYDQFRRDLVQNYQFNPEVAETITNDDIDLAYHRAQKRLEETGFGDIGLVFEELGKMYPGASDMYPGQ